MRVRDIEAGKEYATCDGGLVVPQEPVVKEYVRTYDSKTATYSVVRVKSTDPWGGCGNARRPMTTGIRCLRFDVDRDGERLGDGDEVMVEPRDIKGTWLEYLTLHAAKVREIADKRAWEARVAKMNTAIGAAVRTVFPGLKVYTRVSPAGRDTLSHVNVDVTAYTVDEWDKLAAVLSLLGVDLDDAAQVREFLPVKEDK